MIRRILAPLDGSTRAEAVLPHVRRLARVFQARVDLIHVSEGQTFGEPFPGSDVLSNRLFRARVARYLERKAGELREEGVEVWTRVEQGSPAEVIVGLLRRGEYDLVALTQHGRGGDHTLRMGCTALAVVLNAPTSILLAPGDIHQDIPAGSSVPGYTRVVAPVDCSPLGDWSLAMAARVARKSGAALDVVHVLTPPEMVHRLPPVSAVRTFIHDVMEANRNAAARYLEEVVWRFHGPDLEVRHEIVEARGSVAEALRDFMVSRPVDLLVMAAHGQGGSSAWPLGSTASKVLFQSPEAVLVLQDQVADYLKVNPVMRVPRARRAEAEDETPAMLDESYFT
ncbi:MAG: universal stress protein [Gemmatimonadota bacterium]